MYDYEPAAELSQLLKSLTPMCDEVTHFVTYERGYYAILRSGERIDIVHIHSFQPQIQDYDDYFTYLLVESPQSFFILRQRVLENRALHWEAVLEITALDHANFFREMCWRPDWLESLVPPVEQPE